jgi:hypothetical protein
MSDNFLFDKLVVLNTVYNNSLNEPKIITQPSTIKTKLFPHQASLVNGMHIYRDKMTRGFLLGNQAINGKLGIIGDQAGSGKTLSILSYLSSQIGTFPRITCELTNNSTKYFFSHELNHISDASQANLIIVPHSLFGQWKQEISEHTTLEYVPIETKRFIKGSDLTKNILNSSFVLTTNKCYKFIDEYATQNSIKWNNIFIDEASSIYINSSDPPLKFQFLWLVTNNWIPLIFKNPLLIKSNLYFLKDRLKLNSELENWLLENIDVQYEGQLISSSFFKDYLPFNHLNRGCIVLRNSKELINKNINIPELSNEILQCRPNITLNSLISYYLSRNIEPNISSSKIINLFQALNVNFIDSETYLLNKPVLKHNLIRRKIEENECVICLETTENPTIVDCCFNIYCANCLLKNMLITHKCPTCRDILNVENICCLKELSNNEKILSKNKMEVCMDILNKNKDGKIIIYSSFDNIYYQLFDEIDKLGLKAERLESNIFSYIRTIKNFQDGKTNILFISNIDLIRGLSLQSSTHLIFYHELPVFELKQILLSSVQRIGRKNPLNVIHLNSEIQL